MMSAECRETVLDLHTFILNLFLSYSSKSYTSGKLRISIRRPVYINFNMLNLLNELRDEHVGCFFDIDQKIRVILPLHPIRGEELLDFFAGKKGICSVLFVLMRFGDPVSCNVPAEFCTVS